MSARKIIGGGVVAAALAAGGVVAGTSIAGNDGAPQTTGAVIVAEPIVAQPAKREPTSSAARKKKRKKPTVRYFQASAATIPPEGGGIVQPITCPPGQGEPIAAGAQTTVGLVVNYLSRIHPQTQELPPQTYFVGVEDISSAPEQAGSGAIVEVQCAKNIKVDYGQ
jgi:hypothetical protein